MTLEATSPKPFTDDDAELVARIRLARRNGHELPKQLAPGEFDAEGLIRRLIDEGKIEVYTRT